MIKLKRAYDLPSKDDGKRILVERLWPRGLKKERAELDEWMKDAAPSTELRKWYGHDPEKWHEFERKYWSELSDHQETIGKLLQYVNEGPVTFVFASSDMEHSNARALRDYLELKLRQSISAEEI